MSANSYEGPHIRLHTQFQTHVACIDVGSSAAIRFREIAGFHLVSAARLFHILPSRSSKMAMATARSSTVSGFEGSDRKLLPCLFPHLLQQRLD